MTSDEIDLSGRTVAGLLRLFSAVMKELRLRGVVRSSNNPTADYAEYLVCKALKLDLAVKSTRGYDAVDSTEQRYEIKGRRLTPQNQSRQLSVIRGLDQEHFHYLAGVLFNEDFSIQRACLVPWARVGQEARYRKHVNGWILLLRDALWDQPGVQDITERLREAERAFP